MERIDEIKALLNTLPNGYISKKKIKGKQRFYLQFRDGKKIKSRYIKDNELDEITSQIKQRKILEEELKKIIDSTSSPLGEITQSVLSLTGDIMLFDEVVASFKNGELVYISPQKAPLFIKRTRNLRSWLENRAIDSHRTHSRLLRKALRINTSDSIENVLRVHACTITDSYWYRPSKSKLKYKDVTYKNDLYYDVSLSGNIDSAPTRICATPELTNTGSFEKCWRLINNEWWMYKKGSKDELFAEMFSSTLAQELNIPTAVYYLEGNIIKTKNFASEYNLQPISSLAGEDDSYQNVFNALLTLNDEKILKDYLILMWFDCLVHNVDRHNENLALLTDKVTGRIIGLAPNYDNNLSMFATSLPNDLSRTNDGMITMFSRFIKSNLKAKEIYLNLDIPQLSLEMIEKAMNNPLADVHKEIVTDYIQNGYSILNELKNNLQ